jgi:fatty-acyl-CoA synthase
MATIVADGALDLTKLRAHLHARLPSYARPLFVRIGGALEVTMTFKPKKIELVAQGFDPDRMSDLLYFDDSRRDQFVRLDAALFREIVGGKVRL